MADTHASSPDAFSVHRLSKFYDGHAALDQLDLRFARGVSTALIGSSGSGKSTLLRMLVGLEWPDDGEVRVNGQLLRRPDVLALRQRIGFVVQEGGLFPHLSVLGNLALLPQYLGWTRERIRERAHELAALTHLETSLLSRFPAELSGGQRQRVALMRALMLDPAALLLDEPLGALDPLVRHELQDELKRIFETLGKTVILVTHDLAEAAWFAERLVLMRTGRVVQDGSLRELHDAPAEPFVSQFVQAQRSVRELLA